jgi:hypothetical protein
MKPFRLHVHFLQAPRRHLRGLASLGPSLAMALACAASAAGVWAQGPWSVQALPDAVAEPLAASTQSLFARCTRAMLEGRCRVMDRSSGFSEPSHRVFIAGAGEVDAAVYQQLRTQGDAMCGDVQRECEQAWDGTACRIARALYPEPT